MGTMTKWPVQKHREHHKTRSKQGRNRHKEITIFCVFRFFCFLFSIFNYLKDFSRKCWITAIIRSMKIIGGLNQFSAAANLSKILHHHDLFYLLVHGDNPWLLAVTASFSTGPEMERNIQLTPVKQIAAYCQLF